MFPLRIQYVKLPKHVSPNIVMKGFSSQIDEFPELPLYLRRLISLVRLLFTSRNMPAVFRIFLMGRLDRHPSQTEKNWINPAVTSITQG